MNAVRASMRCVCSCSSSSISSSRSEVVLADLGVSDMLDPHSRLRKKLRTTDSSIHVCTASYRSPDVGLGNYYFSVDVDMWSLGCVTAELHHGRTLFRGIGENPSSKSVINDMLKLLPPPGPVTAIWLQSLPLFKKFYVLRRRRMGSSGQGSAGAAAATARAASLL